MKKFNGKVKKTAWNKGLEVGPREAFTKAEVKRIRAWLVKRGDEGLRDLVLFNTAIDTMLHASDLLSLAVKHVKGRNSEIREFITVSMTGGGHVAGQKVECALSLQTRELLARWIDDQVKNRNAFLFTGRMRTRKAITPRQLSRLVKAWAEAIGLDATLYGTESLRRTRAVFIAQQTGNLDALRALLGHSKIASTARYVGGPQAVNPLVVSRDSVM